MALSSNRVDAPGVVVHSASNSWKLGTPAGALTAQLDDLLMLWRAAGLNVEASAMLRTDIWRKLLVNVPNH
ncbi:2-dehydropantoate 2-reductase [Mycobacteroides abscessus subsp. abscessus]|nr:2-dehydropantoate 2-reductase [Mycobacteroides abscessus subsp. abscessus]